MDTTKQFILQIEENLKRNGYPEKGFPTLEKMYEVADSKGLSFNAVLKVMKEDMGLKPSWKLKELSFRLLRESRHLTSFSLNPEDLKNMDQDELKEKAQSFMKSMSPEQMAEIQKTFNNMSQEEKDELMKKGKEMGLL